MKSVSKLKDQARAYEQKENWQAAIEAYRKVLSALDDTETELDLSLYNRIGDLYYRVGQPDRAVHYYSQAAQKYAEVGLFNNAIALCNKALRYRPNDVNLFRMLGEFSAEQGFLVEARRWYLQYAERQVQTGKVEEAFSALEEFAALADDPGVRETLADQFLAHDRAQEALQQLERAYKERIARGESMEASIVADRIRELDPSADLQALAQDVPPTEATEPDTEDSGLIIETSAGAAGFRDADDNAPPTEEAEAPSGLETRPDDATSAPVDGPVSGLEVGFGERNAAPAQPPAESLAGMETFDTGEGESGGEGEGVAEAGEAEPPQEEALADEEEAAAGGSYPADDGAELAPIEQVEGLETAETAEASPGKPAVETVAAEVEAEAEPREEAEPAAVEELEPQEEPELQADEEPELEADEEPELQADEEPELDADEEPELDAEAEPEEEAEGEEEVAPISVFDAEFPATEDVELDDDAGDEEEPEPLPLLDLEEDEEAEPEDVAPWPDEGEPSAELPVPEVQRDEDAEPEDAAAAFPEPEEVAAELPEPEAPSDEVPAGEEAAAALSELEFEGPLDLTEPPVAETEATVAADVEDEVAPAEESELEAEFAEAEAGGGDEEGAPLPLLDLGDGLLPDLDAGTEAEDALAAFDLSAFDLTLADAGEVVETSPDMDTAAILDRARELVSRELHDQALGELHLLLVPHLDRKVYEDALHVGNEMVRRNPDDFAALQRRVEFASRLGDRQILAETYADLAACLMRKGAETKAATVYQRVLELDPGNDAAREVLGAGEADADSYVDLAAFLDDEGLAEALATGEASAELEDFAELFSQFKAKVTEDVAVEESGSHYDLGLAFKEMGLIDEAIAEFQTALRGGEERLKVYEELGQCFMLKEQYTVAVKILERALELPREDPHELLGVYYHLGMCHEELGDRNAARQAYDNIMVIDPSFSDVPERLSRL